MSEVETPMELTEALPEGEKHWLEMFPSKYVRACDLKGKPHDVKIVKVTSEELQAPGKAVKEKKWIIYFEGREKGFALNKTNAKVLVKKTGDKKSVNKWIGLTITIFPTTCKFGPETVECIRIK